MSETHDAQKQAEKIASSEGGETPPAPAMREQTHSSNKMENELEMQKDNKQGMDSADQVAGRKDKGTLTGLLQKVTGDPNKGDPNKGDTSVDTKNAAGRNT